MIYGRLVNTGSGATFQRDIEDGKRAEEAVKQYFISLGRTVTDVSDVAEYQEQDIDIMVESKDKSQAMISIEIKNDHGIQKYGNVYLELISNIQNNIIGWFLKTKAEYLAFYSEENQEIHFVKTSELKEYIRTHDVRIKTAFDRTVGICLPLEKLKKVKTYYCVKVIK